MDPEIGSLEYYLKMAEDIVEDFDYDAEYILSNSDLEELINAERYLENAQEKGDDIRTELLKGDVARIRGDYELAKDIYLKASKKDPKNNLPFYEMGRILLLQDRKLDALGEFYKSYSLDTEDYDVCQRLGDTLYELRNYEDAIFYLKKAESLSSELEYQLFVDLGCCYQELGDARLAENSFLKAIQLAPEEPSINFSYADLLKSMGDYDGALEQIDKALFQSPEDPDYLKLKEKIVRARDKKSTPKKSIKKPIKKSFKDEEVKKFVDDLEDPDKTKGLFGSD